MWIMRVKCNFYTKSIVEVYFVFSIPMSSLIQSNKSEIHGELEQSLNDFRIKVCLAAMNIILVAHECTENFFSTYHVPIFLLIRTMTRN